MSLKLKTKADEANLWTLEISISAEDFEEAQKKAFNKIKRRLQHPGFRKGKIPRNMAERLFGEGFLFEDALDICYPDAAQKAIDESELDFVGTGKVDILSIGKEGVEIKLEIYVKPEVEISDYKGLEVEVTKFEVTDDEVQAKLDELRERNSRIITVEDRAAQEGDIAKIDFEGFIDGEAFEVGKGEDFDLTLGSGQFIPGFEDQVVGHNVGDEFDVVVTFPEDYGSEELAGKEATFKCALKGLQLKELPELDDEFAQDAADFDTLDELTQSLRDELVQSKKDEQKNSARQQLLDKLAAIVEAEIPACMIDDEVEKRVRDMEYNMQSQGFGLDLYLKYMGMTIEEYKEEMREGAENNIKVRLALEKIAELEGLEVSDEALEEEYSKFASENGMQVEDVKKYVSEDDLRKDLLVNKAVDFIYDNAVITEVEPKNEPEIDVDSIVDAVEAVEAADEDADEADPEE